MPPWLRGEQSLGLLAQDDEVDVARLDVRQRRACPGVKLAGPHAGIQVEQHAQRHLRRQLGAVGLANVGMAHGAEQHRVGRRGTRAASRPAGRSRAAGSSPRRIRAA